MEHDVQFVFEHEHDPFAKPAYVQHSLPLHGVDRWVHASEDEWRRKSNALEHGADYTRSERMAVKLDVGELRHG
jgi:hypothetical protein